MRVLCLVALLCSATAPSCTAQEPVRASLRRMAEGGPVPPDDGFFALFNDELYFTRLPPESVKDILSWSQKLLKDPRPDARHIALTCFAMVAMRRWSDGQDLLEPYVPDLLAIVADRTDVSRLLAAQALTRTLPSLSPKTLAYMTAHLADKENTAEDTSWMAWALLSRNDPRIIRDVIAFVRKQANIEVIRDVLTCIRARQIKPTPDVLALISSGLESPDESTRRRSVEAVADLPAGEKTQFLSQLNRLAGDAKEAREIRSLAAEALKK